MSSHARSAMRRSPCSLSLPPSCSVMLLLLTSPIPADIQRIASYAIINTYIIRLSYNLVSATAKRTSHVWRRRRRPPSRGREHRVHHSNRMLAVDCDSMDMMATVGTAEIASPRVLGSSTSCRAATSLTAASAQNFYMMILSASTSYG